MVHVLKSYCLPFLLHASEAVLPSPGNLEALDNCINRADSNLLVSVICVQLLICRLFVIC